MDIKKITILPMARYMPKIVLNNPSADVVNQKLSQVACNSEKLPARIIRKVAREHKIPDYVNLNSYVLQASHSTGEQAQV